MFKKGVKHSHGGRTKGLGKKVGRPTKLEAEVRRMASEGARKYLEDRFKPIMDQYIALAQGKQTGKVRRRLDPATCRHAVERLIPPAPKTITFQTEHYAEEFYEQFVKEEAEKLKGRNLLEDKTKEPQNKDTLH